MIDQAADERRLRWLDQGLGDAPVRACRHIGGPRLRRRIRFRRTREIFANYLARAPLSHALFRTAEIRQLAKVEMNGPVLDFGCGRGEFASAAVFGELDVGIDLSRRALARATAAGCHRGLACADAANLPLADESFASVLAVSVFEHLADPINAVHESYRVLRPGGRLIATIVLADIHRHLFYPKLFRSLRLSVLARAYARMHDRAFCHRTLLTASDWRELLENAGFQMVLARKIVSPRLICWFDAFLPTACVGCLVGEARELKPRWARRLLWKLFEAVDRDESSEGPVLLIVAEKPGA